ncbi:MAG: YceI family protein [Neisseria sp.]
MKKTLLAILLSLSTAAFGSDYKIDSNHAHARFEIDHFGTTTNKGGFYGLAGNVQFNLKAKTGFISVTIPVRNLVTGTPEFDKHLKNANFFNADQFPEIRFQSTKWHFKDNKVSEVEGMLTMLGKAKPVKLKATKFNCYQSPMLKAEVCGGDFETIIDRTQWGMDYLVNIGMSKQVKLTIQIEAVKI